MSVYKTVITVEVLSDGPYEFQGIKQLAHDVVEGDCSGYVDDGESIELTQEKAIAECGRHSTDPEWFFYYEDEMGEE